MCSILCVVKHRISLSLITKLQHAHQTRCAPLRWQRKQVQRMATNSSAPLRKRLAKLSKKELESRDVFGRCLIHLVCLLGRFDLLKALLSNTQCQVALLDRENGWTAFHYAVYYGKLVCARLLLEHDVGLLRVKDRNGLTAMDIYHLEYSLSNSKIWPQNIGKYDTKYVQRFTDVKSNEDPLIWWDRDKRGGSDVYTFGVNVNYQLGTGDADDKSKTPFKINVPNLRLTDDSLSIADRLVKPRIKAFAISKNHSVLLTNEVTNNILVAGNASRGRLGNGSSAPNYRFKHVEYFENEQISAIAVSDDHTLALTPNGHVYSWGLNNYQQLGYNTEVIKEKTDTFGDVPKRVINGLKRVQVNGISCSKIHSCAYSKSSIIIWGLNVGQMDIISTGENIQYGKLKGSIQVPRTVDFPQSIKQVIATEEATIVLLETDECHILTHGNRLKFQIPMFKALNEDFKFFRPTAFSRKMSIVKLASKDASRIAILYNDGSVSQFGVDMFSKNSNIKYTVAWSPRYLHLRCTDVDIGRDGSIIIATKAGCVYKRVARKNKTDFKFTKIDRISKVVSVSCDSLFTSFGFIKDDVDQLPLDLFKNRFLVDVHHLSPLGPYVSGRKRSELIATDQYESYDINFLNKPAIKIIEDESSIFQKQFDVVKEEEENILSDPLLNAYMERWSTSQPITNTFQKPKADDAMGWLAKEQVERFATSDYSGKDYDVFFQIEGLRFGAHKTIISLVHELKALMTEDLTIGEVRFQVIKDGVSKIENLNAVSLLIMLNLLYTGEFLKPWESNDQMTSNMRIIQRETLSLLKSLGLIDELNRSTYDLHEVFSDRDAFQNDITVRLKDSQEISCWSVLLKNRGAYFETLLSERWDGDGVLDFPHVTKEVFNVVLDYIYGCEQLNLLDHFDVSNIPDFINFCFDLIELSDELLLFGLKDFAQLQVKDFINSENCLLILHHADSMNCQKLIGECLWFVYNNVDSFLNDPNFELLNDGTVARIDKYCRWLGTVNKYIAPGTKKHWYESGSDELLQKFLSSRRDFNDIFLSSDDFVPLFDTPSKKAEVVLKSPRIEPKKVPQPVPVITSMMERRVSSTTPIQRPSFADQLRRPSTSGSSAIEFTDDDFQPVVNRRRKSSSSRRASSSSTTSVTPLDLNSVSRPNSSVNAGTTTPSRSIPHPMYKTRNNSSGSIGEHGFFMTARTSVSNTLSPMSSWGSPKSSSPLGNSPLNIGGGSWAKLDSTLPSSSKMNFGPKRLSQKERKKMMKSQADTPTSTPLKNESPWKLPSRGSSPTSAITMSSTSSIQTAKDEALAKELAAKEDIIPSLRGIIREEKHKVVENQKFKSLAEVKQEEEFARWWAEESRRVQQDMMPAHSLNANNDSGCGSSSSKRKPKKRYDRVYRKQSVP